MTPTVRRILLSQSLEKKAQSIVRRNGIAMYVPIPGVTCFQDSACTIPAAVDDPVGGLKDYLGLYPATQSTSGYRPILRGKVKNWLLNSASLSTQSVAVAVSGIPWTLSFEGTGTVTLSGGYSGALVGTGETDRVSLSFTSTANTNITYTVSGTVSNAQLELGSVANPYVLTTSAVASSSYGPYWLDFDGVDDFLEIANPFFQDIDTYGFYSIVMSVSKESLAYNNFTNPCAKDHDASTLCALHYANLNSTRVINWDNVISDVITLSASMTNKHLFSFKKASQTFLSYVDTVFNNTLQIRTSYTGNHAAIGNRKRQPSNPAQLNFYGMYHGKTNISDKEKSILDSYLMKKSGLSI